MSLSGGINNASGGIRRAIENIVKNSMTDLGGAVMGTRKIFGYVCAIHTDGELAGTIDVQEFNYEPNEYDTDGAGHHKGVLLSAIQNNADGFLIVPMLYSEVVIVQNHVDGNEYVLMYSHAQQIQMKVSSLKGKNNGLVTIGVSEVEDFVETDDGLDKDYDELEKTNNQSSTKYDSNSITHSVTSKDDDNGYTERITAGGKVITVGDVVISVNKDEVVIRAANIKVESDNATIKASKCDVNGSEVTITGGTLKVQGTSSTDLNGPFNAIKVCPFSGAPHCGSSVSGT